MNPSGSPPSRSGHRRDSPPPKPAPPWSDAELARLEALLDAVPVPLEALDVAMLDGFLCGVLLQPRPVPPADWWPHVLDLDGRPAPDGFDAGPLRDAVMRRHRELGAAIAARRRFDPWVFELLPEEGEAGDPALDITAVDEDDAENSPVADACYPWVAGFVTALDLFPGLLALDPATTLEPLARIYRHLGPDDLEDADDLLAEIEALEPPADLEDAVEDLVRATLLLADAARPVADGSGATSGRPNAGAPRRGPSRR